MKPLLSAVVFAAIFAAVATQAYVLVFSGNHLVLHGLSFFAALFTGLATVRFCRAVDTPRKAVPAVEQRRRPAHGNKRSDAGERGASGAKRNSAAKRETGTVKWFDAAKGYGFVIRESGEEIFVHHRSIRGRGGRALADGQAVSFVAVKRSRGLQAEEVEAVDGAST